MIIFRLALQSLANRWLTALLTIFSIALSVMLLLGVEKVRTGARQSFADTISGTDLIVGARSGSLNLLLYSVFRIGNATNNITWKTYQDIAARPEIAWIVPISLGDSHHGFRVMGTTPDYFKLYHYRHGHPLEFASGGPFSDLFDAVIGADVAAELGYKSGRQDHCRAWVGLRLLRGARRQAVPRFGRPRQDRHAGRPHRACQPRRPSRRSMSIGRAARAFPGQSVSAEEVRKMNLEPKAITAAFIGLKSKLAAFRLQRAINEYPEEPLSAILPGAALQELWGLVGTAETALVGCLGHGGA